MSAEIDSAVIGDGAAQGPAVPRSESVKSAYRTLQLLELLADTPGRLTLADLQRRLGVPKSSLHGLLQTLAAAGWVDQRDGTYGIGVRALRIGAAYLDHDPMVRSAGPLLAALQRQLDETVHLVQLDGSDVVYLASRESQHHLRVVSRIGRRLPVHTTAHGKALLAARSTAEVDALLPATLVALTPEHGHRQAGARRRVGRDQVARLGLRIGAEHAGTVLLRGGHPQRPTPGVCDELLDPVGPAYRGAPP